ncbi:MAG: hypothetical protein Q8907_02030 [Bacteroidota bacterium]|nr:hypothetical protein [Bacteroidota bacterium]MDP4273036.1 hypothetical protein [Bacteroidota bacterium]
MPPTTRLADLPTRPWYWLKRNTFHGYLQLCCMSISVVRSIVVMEEGTIGPDKE